MTISFTRGFPLAAVSCLATLTVLALAINSAAQPPAKPIEKKIPEPEELDLQTRDGVELKATYYPGLKGKDTVPVILLHMWQGNRADWGTLPLYLQRQGHAVVVPDLRGHGRSTRFIGPNGEEKALDGETLRVADMTNMYRFDVEAIKSFLLAQNNEGLLNIEKLCVIGAEMGAGVALNWAMIDWSWQQLPNLKQGRDVKALVLISPTWTFRGMRINQAVAAITAPEIQPKMSVMIIVGNQDPKFFKDAKRLFTTLERFHPLPPVNERAEKQDLFFLDQLRTRLQGTTMLTAGTLRLEQQISQFIDLRLVQKSYPWTDRASPLE